MAKKKYYAVAVGRSSGIFTDWPTAEKQVKGFTGAKYKSFTSEAEARDWLENPVYQKKERRETGDQLIRSHEDDPDAIVVYTDGGAINNPGPGGYGVVVEMKDRGYELSGGFRLTTNNRMEMMAAIVALRELQGTQKNIHLYSDSSYLVNGISKGWAQKWRSNGWRKSDGQEAMNIDLWQELLALIDVVKVRFSWVKGHAGNELNERCDRLAVAAARQSQLEVDVEYENALKKQCLNSL